MVKKVVYNQYKIFEKDNTLGQGEYYDTGKFPSLSNVIPSSQGFLDIVRGVISGRYDRKVHVKEC